MSRGKFVRSALALGRPVLAAAPTELSAAPYG